MGTAGGSQKGSMSTQEGSVGSQKSNVGTGEALRRAAWAILGLLEDQCGRCWDTQKSSVGSARVFRGQHGQCHGSQESSVGTAGALRRAM